MPFISWMQTNGRPVRDRLQSVDLDYAVNAGPDLPISRHQAVALLRAESRMEGPDYGARVVSGSSLRDLGTIGEIALGGGTLRQALLRVAKAIPTHVSHEVVSVVSTPSGMVLRELWGLKLDDETRHFVQQYFAALIQALCKIAGAQSPVFENVVLTPHPEHGLAHLEPWFGKGLEAADDKTLVLVIPARFGDLALPLEAGSEHRSVPTTETGSLQSDGGFSASVKILIESMLRSGTPTVEGLASAAGLSVRTFQRRLHAEGTSFLMLLDEARHGLSLVRFGEAGEKAGGIAVGLGYGQQSSFTRAVRRWTGKTPRTLLRRKD
jgi:AraC-like DNA-binding protein